MRTKKGVNAMFDFSRNAARYFAAAAATLFLISCGGSDDTPAPPPFGSTTLILGSSLSDTGNQCQAKPSECLPTPPAYQQLDSNGPIWVTTVAARYGASAVNSLRGGTNFAYADARTGTVPSFGTTAPTPPIAPSLLEQTETMLARNGFNINPQFLVILEAGGAFSNNAEAALGLVLANPASATTIVGNTVTAALTDVVGILNRLYAAGARNVVLVNSPNLGAIPASTLSGNPLITTLLTQMAGGFNANLATQVNNVKAVSPGLNVYLVDAFVLQSQVQANPAAFGFANATQPCFVQATATTPQILCSTDPAVQNTFFFWDTKHPTYATGQLVAQRAIAAIGR
jgi:outer membrane lipase/esterase